MRTLEQGDDGERAGNDAIDASTILFRESVRASNVAVVFAGGIYVALIALFISVPILGQVEGSGAWSFYSVMAVAIAALSFVLTNFMVLKSTVSAEGLAFRFGILTRHFNWQQIRSFEARPYRWLSYGGWGIRWVPGVGEPGVCSAYQKACW